MSKHKFEKVDNNTIRIIMEQAQEVPLIQIIANRKVLLTKKFELEETLKNLDEIIANAKRLGIVVKEPTAKIKKIRDKDIKG